MPDQQDIEAILPLFDEAAQAIKAKGEYQKELTAQELASIMLGIVLGLLRGQDTITASVPTLTVKIEKAIGTVAGTVSVEKPIQAVIKVVCVLDNDAAPNRIKLAKLNIHQEASFAAKLALKLVDIEGKTKEALRDPNQALRAALTSQLGYRGVRLTAIELHFKEQTLTVNLKGEAA